jgi:hypothetical protein
MWAPAVRALPVSVLDKSCARLYLPTVKAKNQAARSGTPIAEPVGAPLIEPDDGGHSFSRAAAAIAMAVVIMAVIVWIVVSSGALQ